MSDFRKSYGELLELEKEISLINSISNVLFWDNETYLPANASKHREDQIAFLASMAHEKSTSDKIRGLLNTANSYIEELSIDSVEAVNMREWQRNYEKLVKLPGELVEKLSRISIQAQNSWLEAKKMKEYKLFQADFEKIIELKKQEADCLGFEDEPYDALLDDYEPGLKTSEISEILNDLKKQIIPILQHILASENIPDTTILKTFYPPEKQEKFARKFAQVIGYNFESGRVDKAHHPFSIRLGPQDVRITSRCEDNYFPSLFFSILHESGHGIYDQNLNSEHYGTPMGKSVSLGIHESQSRLWENMVGRSKSFWKYAFPLAKEYFPQLAEIEMFQFYAAVNEVTPSFIRVEADELTYNLHILLRFEIERSILNGEIKAKEVPEFWNSRFEEYFGLKVPDPSLGCLQDIHWCNGLIGYFPTYALGNLMAAQLMHKVNEEINDLDSLFEKGDFVPLKNWLTENVHKQGMKYRSLDLIQKITGEPLNAKYLIAYLKNKYQEIYDISFV